MLSKHSKPAEVLQWVLLIGMVVVILLLVSGLMLQREMSQLRTYAAPEAVSRGTPWYCYLLAFQCLVLGNQEACRKYDQYCGTVP